MEAQSRTSKSTASHVLVLLCFRHRMQLVMAQLLLCLLVRTTINTKVLSYRFEAHFPGAVCIAHTVDYTDNSRAGG